jgi:hypothetical protein
VRTCTRWTWSAGVALPISTSWSGAAGVLAKPIDVRAMLPAVASAA